MAELDLLAWQLRLRDGTDAAMPRSLKRQLMKSSRKAVAKAHQPAQASHSADVFDSLISTDLECKDLPGMDWDQLLGCCPADPTVLCSESNWALGMTRLKEQG